MLNCNIVKLTSRAKLPSRESDDAAGYDVYALLDEGQEAEIIRAHETTMIHTGLAMQIPRGYFCAVFARSGLAYKNGLRPANCVGVIDSDYRGEIMVALHNDTDIPQKIYQGDRIAQIVIVPHMTINFNEVKSLEDTERGTGGFGSTGAQ